MTITDYRNFDLLITRAGECYRAFVVEAPADEDSVVFDLPFAMDGVARLDTWMSGDHDHQATCPPKEDDGPVVWIRACLAQEFSAVARSIEKQAQRRVQAERRRSRSPSRQACRRGLRTRISGVGASVTFCNRTGTAPILA